MNVASATKAGCALILMVVSFGSSGVGGESASKRFERTDQLAAADHLPAELAAAGAESGPLRASAAPARRSVETPVSEPCAQAMEVVNRAGLRLAPGTTFRCPGNTETTPGDRQHSGVACFDHQWYCPQSSYIAVNPDQIRGGDRGMQYVIAHEICHIESYLATGTPGAEDAADACAAAAGFPR